MMVLPDGVGRLSYGTVSPDERFYAVSVLRPDKNSCLLLIDLSNGSNCIMASSADQFFKHEQFSRDGRNKVLIQANSTDSTASVVNLGEVGVDQAGVNWLPVHRRPLSDTGSWPGGDQHTPRCTGHETWIGQTGRVLLSTEYSSERNTSIWSVAGNDTSPTVVCKTWHKFGHISVSSCGRFWVADSIYEEGVPIYIGSFSSGTYRRLVFSHTRHSNQQWSHTHPYLTADNRWLIFTSDRSGHPQVYGGCIQEELLESLNCEAVEDSS